MAGIYSQGGSAGHRYAGWLSEVEAKNFIFGGKVFNGSPSAIYVGSNLVWAGLKDAAMRAILGAFGQTDGKAVINATNAYLNQLAASDRDKATALAGFINEGVTTGLTYLNYDGHTCFDTGIVHTLQTSIEADIIATAANTWGYFWGAEDTGDGPTGLSLQRRQSGKFRGTVNGYHMDYDINCVLGQKYHILESRYELYIDGNNIPHHSGTPTECHRAMVIACLRTGANIQADGWCHIGRIYPIKWREGETLAHWYLPAGDNRLFDLATQTELTPAKGTGAIYGKETP